MAVSSAATTGSDGAMANQMHVAAQAKGHLRRLVVSPMSDLASGGTLDGTRRSVQDPQAMTTGSL